MWNEFFVRPARLDASPLQSSKNSQIVLAGILVVQSSTQPTRIKSMSTPESGKPAAGKSTGNSGSELPADVRSGMEKSFGEDFSKVRVHTSASVGETGGAKAHTKGHDIFFAPGQYSPDSAHGKKLIAHELAHVVQQSPGAKTNIHSNEKTGEAQKELSSQLAASGKSVPLK